MCKNYIFYEEANGSIAPLIPGSPGSDLNPVIRTYRMCSAKCAEAAWNYKSGRHGAPYIICIIDYFILSLSTIIK